MHITGKQIGGGSLTGTPRSFITPIGTTPKVSSAEKVKVQLVSPVQQTEEMARDMTERNAVKRGIKRKSATVHFSSIKRRRKCKSHEKSRKQKLSNKKKVSLPRRKKNQKKKKSKAPLKKGKKNIKKKLIKSVKNFKDIFG